MGSFINLDYFCLVKYTSAGHNHIQSIRLVNYTSSIPSKYASMLKSYFLKTKQNKIKSTQKGDNDCRMSRGDWYEPKDQIDHSQGKGEEGPTRARDHTHEKRNLTTGKCFSGHYLLFIILIHFSMALVAKSHRFITK